MTAHEKRRIQKSLWLRFKAKTPKFFKRLSLISIGFGTALISTSDFIASNFPQYVTLEARLDTLGGICLVMIPIICKATVDFDAALTEKV